MKLSRSNKKMYNNNLNNRSEPKREDKTDFLTEKPELLVILQSYQHRSSYWDWPPQQDRKKKGTERIFLSFQFFVNNLNKFNESNICSRSTQTAYHMLATIASAVILCYVCLEFSFSMEEEILVNLCWR